MDMNARFYSTVEVAELIGVRVCTLSRAVWDGRVQRPAKAPGNHAYLWVEDDIHRASEAFRGRDASDIFEVKTTSADQGVDSDHKRGLPGCAGCDEEGQDG